MLIQSVNPTTGTVNKIYESHSLDGVHQIINAVDKSWNKWRATSFAFRSRLMLSMASLLRSKKEELALLMAKEMGKVRTEGTAEIEKCAWVCEYYANHAESFLANEKVETKSFKSYISYQSLGVILGIMPWNFPFWQVFRFAVPALMAGNTVILKHASNVPGCALAIEELFREADFHENVFRTLLVSSSQVEHIIAHKAVRGVSLTGSTPAGKSVAALAGKYLKKCVLELGGNDPYIILRDADIELAAQKCAAGRLLNAGQSCIGAKRFIVEEVVYAHFLEEFTHQMNAARFGDPFDSESTMGPLARVDLRDELHRQVIDSVKLGAEIILGGEIPNREGAFYPPTILENVKAGMPAYHEELFGPVATVIKVKDVQEALKIANDSEFGLGAAVFTADRERAEKLAEFDLQAGCCFVNDFVKSDPRLPFGGIKNSGFGRELAAHGIKEFVNVKSVVIQ